MDKPKSDFFSQLEANLKKSGDLPEKTEQPLQTYDPQGPQNDMAAGLSDLKEALDNEEQFGGAAGAAEAYLGSAAAAGTFELSDVALRALGVSAKRLKAPREVQPGPALAGTATGIIAPMVASFGAAAPLEAGTIGRVLQKGAAATMPASVARTISAPLHGVGAVGTAAENMLERIAPNAAAYALAKPVARGVAEGALIGAGQAAGEIAKEDQPLAAETIYDSIGAGALYGGVFGTLLGTAGAAGEKVLGKSAKPTTKLGSIINETFENTFDEGRLAVKSVGGTPAKQQLLYERYGEEELPRYLKGPLNHGSLETFGSLNVKNKAQIELAKNQIESLIGEAEGIMSVNGSPFTREQAYQPLIEALEEEKAKLINVRSAKEKINQLNDYIEEVKGFRDKTIRTPLKSAEEIAQIETQQLSALKELQEVSAASQERQPALKFQKKVPVLEAELKKLSAAQRNLEELITARTDKERTKIAQQIEDNLRNQEKVAKQLSLTDAQFKEAKKGTARADQLRQRSVLLEAQQKDLQAEQLRLKQERTEHPEIIRNRQALEKNVARQGEITTQIAENRKMVEEHIKLEVRKNQLQESIKALQAEKLAESVKPAPFDLREMDQLRKNYQSTKYPKFGEYDPDGLQSFKAQTAGKLRGVLREQIDKTAEKLSGVAPKLADDLKDANWRYHMGKAIEGPLADAAFKTPDMLSSTLFGIISNTATRVARNFIFVNEVGSKMKAMKDMIIEGIKGAASNKGAAAPLHGGGINLLVTSGFATRPDGKKAKTPVEAFNNIQQNLNEAQNDPEGFSDRLIKKTAPIAAASPETAQILQERLIAAVQLLSNKIPKSSVSAGMFERDFQPSTMQMAKFARYVQVVERPMSVVAELKRGTLTREHVEALQVVAPEIYKTMQQETINFLASDAAKKLPYNKKLQISMLLNVPVDSAMQPQHLMKLQQTFAPQQPEQPSQQAPAVRPSAIEDYEMSERAESGTEKLSNR